MIYLDDNIVHHPKILKAGALIGGDAGGACALALFVDGLGYARKHLTDGFIPTQIVKTCALVADPLAVAEALVATTLWFRVPGGFSIHDYTEWNQTKAEIGKKRRRWRLKKRRQRRGNNGQFSERSSGDSPRGHSVPPGRVPRLARTRAIPQPRPKVRTSTNKPLRTFRRTSTANQLTARGIFTHTKKKTPTHRILCAMLAAELRDDPAISNALEGVKLRLVRQGFAYPEGDLLDRAVQSVERVRRKGAA